MFLLNNKVQTGRYKTFLHFPECSLSFAKIVQTSGKKARFCFPECSLSYAKTMQTSGKKARFCFPECSLSYAKIVQTLFPTKQNPLFLASPHPCLIAATAHPSSPG